MLKLPYPAMKSMIVTVLATKHQLPCIYMTSVPAPKVPGGKAGEEVGEGFPLVTKN